MSTAAVHRHDSHESALEGDGFVLFPGFFERGLAEQARQEMVASFERDLAERAAAGVTDYHHYGSAGHTVLTPPMHNMIDVYGQSPTLDGMYARLLTDPLTAPLVRYLAGPHIKARAFNCRWMTGAYDPPPAHDWHRDSPGACNFGILLTDTPPSGNAATGFIRGSHRFPYNPVTETILSERYEGPKAFRKWNLFNRALGRRMRRLQAEAAGQQGDAYLFTNELWHGRQPNLHGGRTMVVLMAFYPTSFPFTSEVKEPPPPVLERLPAPVREVVRLDKPQDPAPEALAARIQAERRPPSPASLFYWARAERRFAEAIGARKR
jgi:hypothetical protein